MTSISLRGTDTLLDNASKGEKMFSMNEGGPVQTGKVLKNKLMSLQRSLPF